MREANLMLTNGIYYTGILDATVSIYISIKIHIFKICCTTLLAKIVKTLHFIAFDLFQYHNNIIFYNVLNQAKVICLLVAPNLVCIALMQKWLFSEDFSNEIILSKLVNCLFF